MGWCRYVCGSVSVCVCVCFSVVFCVFVTVVVCLGRFRCVFGSVSVSCLRACVALVVFVGRCRGMHVTITHGKRLSYSNSAVFADTMVPSRCHRNIIRCPYAGIARASRGRVDFMKQSGWFLFPSHCLRETLNAR